MQIVCEEPCKKTKKEVTMETKIVETGGQENELTRDPHYTITNSDFITQTPQINKGKK